MTDPDGDTREEIALELARHAATERLFPAKTRRGPRREGHAAGPGQGGRPGEPARAATPCGWPGGVGGASRRLLRSGARASPGDRSSDALGGVMLML